MSVPQYERGSGKMEVFMKARDLSVHTIRICANEKVFDPKYSSAITNDIIHTATEIFIKIWTANNIRVKDGEDWKERKHLQEAAIRDCNNLLALMQIAKPLFHLSSRKVKYWGTITIEVRTLISAWKEADQKRYGKM